MHKFRKDVKELETRFDKWMFVLRNLNKLERIPDELREGIFERLFEVAEIAKFSPAEVQAYENSMKIYRDLKNSLDTAREEAIDERNAEVVKLMHAESEPIEKIMRYTGLQKNEIEKIIGKG